MCVIIIKDNKKVISTNTLVASASINPHGLGVLWLDKWNITYHDSNDFMILKTDRPFIAHFRYATVGAVNKANCHPFNINKNEVLFQNGTVWNLGSKKKTDTQHMAEILSDIPKRRWAEVLEMNDCRFVTADLKKKTYKVYNEADWIVKNKIMYSKKNVLGKHLIAVYGTLKKDYSNYQHYLTQSKYVGPAMTIEKYPLLIEGLPFLLNKPGVGEYVELDLFLVDDITLGMIDGLEGHPDWYYREKIDVDTKDGTILNASVYFNDREDSGIHHKTYTQELRPLSTFDGWDENYQEEYECDCDSPQKVWDEWDNEFYCLDCMCTIKETI